MPIYGEGQELRKVMQSAREIMRVSEVTAYDDTMLPGVQSIKETARRMVGATPEMRPMYGRLGTRWSGRRAGKVGGLMRGFDDVGLTLPADHQIGDRRGYSTTDSSMLKVVSGHTDGAGDEGEVSIKHAKDKVLLGHKDLPTTWYVHKRKRTKDWTGKWGNWGTDWQREIAVPANKPYEIENQEGGSLDYDIYITLLTVGKSVEEQAEYQKTKTDASSAIANAKAASTKLKSIGGDNTSVEKSIATAEAAYAKADYAGALASANTASTSAIDLTALQEKLNIELQKKKVRDDPTLDQKTKDDMVKNLDDQKKLIDDRANTDKKDLGLPTIDFKNPMVIGGIIAVIAIIGVAGAAAAVMSKKKATA